MRDKAVAMMMAAIRDDLAALDVKPDVFYSERSLLMSGEDRVGAAIELLRQRGYVYEGRLPPPKGAPTEDWEDREQTLFRSTAFGDDVDRALKKSDGSYTYFASDIAYHRSKLERGFRHSSAAFSPRRRNGGGRGAHDFPRRQGGQPGLRGGAIGRTSEHDWTGGR